MVKRLVDVKFDGEWIDITPSEVSSAIRNYYTVIIGKNGIGKSRLLADLVRAGSVRRDFKRIIGISTSPFDKFPSAKRPSLIISPSYRYVGMRTESIYQSSSSVSLISSAAKGLLEKLSKTEGSHDLNAVFQSLQFEPSADFLLKPSYLRSKRKESQVALIEGSSLAIELRRLEREHDIHVDERYFELLQNLSLGRRLEVLDSMVKVGEVLTSKRAIELNANFAASTLSVDGQPTSTSTIRAILVLMEVGLVRLIDLVLEKQGFGQLSLKKASSGEQCLLVLILGIAGHICDESLVLIDEPEISLHPRWQEEFMELLINSFAGYRDCQFVIATHSPQIIARLRGEGCYIVSLTRGELYDATDFHDKSADFQLAELFDAPGIMNEYISRLAFNLLAKVKHSKSLDDTSRDDLKRLLKFDEQLESKDPVKELIRSVAMLCETYADDH
ncbi:MULTISPECIES: AAA family ATPase [Pseudomonas]|uniref:ATP-binding protein n=1 Tax=Pseudomonas kurunegalensis TaxID=485880 RepID=A0ACC5UHF8_9PSED|nr:MULTISPECIES: ATP-binding protein [Pseudomonas]MBC3421868.1 ATP-binding protein [Pseudomonas sp. RW3S2]MBV4513868.1 ATP-binding protein [Pseudomonas kurunegalensis]